MDQTLVNAFFTHLVSPNMLSARKEILQGLVLKAVCLRHKGLDAQAMLSEDEADELLRLTEALNHANIVYGFDKYGSLELDFS